MLSALRDIHLGPMPGSPCQRKICSNLSIAITKHVSSTLVGRDWDCGDLPPGICAMIMLMSAVFRSGGQTELEIAERRRITAINTCLSGCSARQASARKPLVTTLAAARFSPQGFVGGSLGLYCGKHRTNRPGSHKTTRRAAFRAIPDEKMHTRVRKVGIQRERQPPYI